LVIGNANAGKTTILEKVCHANGRKPVYLDDKGNKVRRAHLPLPMRFTLGLDRIRVESVSIGQYRIDLPPQQ